MSTGTATASKPRILFVDDDPRVVDALRAILRRQRRRWEMSFVCASPENSPLEHIADKDVVVSDLRMPKVDGLRVLEAVRERSPNCFRMLLTGQGSQEQMQAASLVAHHILHKPARNESVVEIVEHCLALRDRIVDADASAALLAAEGFPILRVVSRKVAALASDGLALRCLLQELPVELIKATLEFAALCDVTEGVASVQDLVARHDAMSIEKFVLAAELCARVDPSVRQRFSASVASFVSFEERVLALLSSAIYESATRIQADCAPRLAAECAKMWDLDDCIVDALTPDREGGTELGRRLRAALCAVAAR